MSKLELLTDPRKFVPYWVQGKQLKIQGNLITAKLNQPVELSMVSNVIWLDYQEEIRSNNSKNDGTIKIKGFPEKDLEKALAEYLEIQRQGALDEAREAVKCSGEDLTELKRFLNAVTGTCDDVQLSVLAHTIWQVKRKLFGLKVKDHMMVIFKGSQGAGKTEAIKVLFEVLKPWFKNATLKEITDERWKHFFKNTYIVFCDELQYAELANVDSLKGIISAEDVETRRLGHNVYDHIVQNSTFVGASNKSVWELIRDNTGMRRFFELQTLPKMDWDTINSIDQLKLWKGIDENKDEPYVLPFKHRINELQAELVVKDPEQIFLEEFILLDDCETREIFISNDQLYSVYKEWSLANGERSKSASQFHKKIKNQGMNVYSCKVGHASKKGYWVGETIRKTLEEYGVFASLNRLPNLIYSVNKNLSGDKAA